MLEFRRNFNELAWFGGGHLQIWHNIKNKPIISDVFSFGKHEKGSLFVAFMKSHFLMSIDFNSMVRQVKS